MTPDHWDIRASCPRCGGPLDHVTEGRVTTWELRAVVTCERCKLHKRGTFQLAVRLISMDEA